MPANLSPEYKEAEAAYRAAREPEEKLSCLRQMLRTIPKHKGTDHMQADLKTRIKELTEDIAKAKKQGKRGPSVAIRPEGAAQLALLGPPNGGKSSLHARLTGSSAVASPAPHVTQVPLPGMLKHLDIQFQLVDLPSISEDFMQPWMPNALVHADGALLVVDIEEPDVLTDVAAIRSKLAEKRYDLTDTPPAILDDSSMEAEESPQRTRELPTLMVATKSDLMGSDPQAELAAFGELAELPFQTLLVSTETGAGLDEIGRRLFDFLRVVRVYTKVPGHAPEMSRPFTLRQGATVQQVARLVHRGMAEEVKNARIWGAGCFPGQHVSHDHRVSDGDVIELHW